MPSRCKVAVRVPSSLRAYSHTEIIEPQLKWQPCLRIELPLIKRVFVDHHMTHSFYIFITLTFTTWPFRSQSSPMTAPKTKRSHSVSVLA